MKSVIEQKSQKGLAPLVIVLAVAALVMAGFLASRAINPVPEKIAVTPSITPTATASATPTKAPTKISKASPIAVPTRSPATPAPTQAAVQISAPAPAAPTAPSYSVDAQLVCARADEGYASGNHVDFTWQVFINETPVPFTTLTLTDNKTKEVIDFGNTTNSGNDPVSSWNGLGHWAVRDRDGKEMPFVADGREYTVKLYRMTTVSQAVTQDLQPVAQKTFSKTCEY